MTCLTSKLPSMLKLMRLKPPYAALIWSCEPTASLSNFLLYVDCIGSERMLVAHLVFEGIQTQQKPDRKRRTRAQASPGRQISNVVNLNSFVDAQILQASADGWMLDRAVVVDVFNFRIRDDGCGIRKMAATAEQVM